MFGSKSVFQVPTASSGPWTPNSTVMSLGDVGSDEKGAFEPAKNMGLSQKNIGNYRKNIGNMGI